MSTPFDQDMHLTKLGVTKFLQGELEHSIIRDEPDGVRILVHGTLHVVFQEPLADGTLLGRMELCEGGSEEPIMHICRFEIPGEHLLDEIRLQVAGLPGLEVIFKNN